MLTNLRTAYHPVPLAIVIALGVAGIYWFSGELRKVETPATATNATAPSDLKSLATGPLAATAATAWSLPSRQVSAPERRDNAPDRGSDDLARSDADAAPRTGCCDGSSPTAVPPPLIRAYPAPPAPSKSSSSRALARARPRSVERIVRRWESPPRPMAARTRVRTRDSPQPCRCARSWCALGSGGTSTASIRCRRQGRWPPGWAPDSCAGTSPTRLPLPLFRGRFRGMMSVLFPSLGPPPTTEAVNTL